MNFDWIPSRAEGLERLKRFGPNAGADYAHRRNFDFGPQDRGNISGLSPYIGLRLIREREVCAAVLNQHSFAEAEKFIQEVCWRTYWKGWLEMRPQVWHSYRRHLDHQDPSGSSDYAGAVTAQTGIQCFDTWCNELLDHGYLHNHARMWFASIWIFTLELPWQWGADFFLQHLLDGDAASNTLSWRWVAGLHTQGKHYVARSANIEKFSGGRFSNISGLNETPEPRLEDLDLQPAVLELPSSRSPVAGSGLLIAEHDLHAESLVKFDPAALAVLKPVARSPNGSSSRVTRFVGQALDDAARRAVHFDRLAESEPILVDDVDAIVRWARSANLKEVVCSYPSVGPVRDALINVEAALNEQGVNWIPIIRPWDQIAWPHASKGYFPFKKHLRTFVGD